jgi:hypothetical protein
VVVQLAEVQLVIHQVAAEELVVLMHLIN